MTEAGIIIIILALAALVQGYGGFGFGIVAMSLLALFCRHMEQLAISVSLVAFAVVLTLLFLSRSQGRVRWRIAWLLLLGIIIGQPVGYWFIATCGERPVFRIILGVFLIAAGITTGAGTERLRNLPKALGVPVGVFSGFLAGAFVTGGPPIVIYLYSLTEDPREMKSTIQLVFMSSLVCRLAIIPFGDGYQLATVTTAAIAIPLAVAAMIAGHLFSRRGSASRFRLVVSVAVCVCGVISIAKAALA